MKRYCEGASPVEGSKLPGTVTLTVRPWILAEPGGNWVLVPLARSMTVAVGVSEESSETTTTASNLMFGRFVNGRGSGPRCGRPSRQTRPVSC